jgi:hypothetical protein
MADIKRDRFARLAPARVNKIREGLRVLSNCSNKNNYTWKQNQMQLLFGLLMREFISCAEAFDVTVSATVNDIDVRTIPD